MMRIILTAFIAAVVMFSCGDAGVQVKVGDDYVSTFNVIDEQNSTVYTANAVESDINTELKEFGAFVRDVEVELMTVELDNYEGSAFGDITITVENSVIVELSNVDFNSPLPIGVDDQVILDQIAALIENDDIDIFVVLETNEPLGDSEFSVIVTLSVVGTATD